MNRHNLSWVETRDTPRAARCVVVVSLGGSFIGPLETTNDSNKQERKERKSLFYLFDALEAIGGWVGRSVCKLNVIAAKQISELCFTKCRPVG